MVAAAARSNDKANVALITDKPRRVDPGDLGADNAGSPLCCCGFKVIGNRWWTCSLSGVVVW